MKLATYNILYGGAGPAASRLPRIIDVLKNIAPDFVAIQEANNFHLDDKAILKKMSAELSARYFDISVGWAESKHGFGTFGVAGLSRLKVRTIDTHDRRFKNGMLHSVVTSPIGDISIVSAHLRADTEDDRLPEAEWIIQIQKNYEHRVVMGDLNSLSPLDTYPPALIGAFNGKQRKKFTADTQLRCDVLQRLFDNGYRDAAAAGGVNGTMTVPTASNADAAHQTPLRVDYVLLSESLLNRLTGVAVIKNEKTDAASDHYPVVCELDV